MTGYQSKRAAAQDKLDDDDDTQIYKDHGDALTIAYQSGYYDGKKAALAGREWNFCERCGKRTADLTTIHTCTPPQEKNTSVWVLRWQEGRTSWAGTKLL
jgi:hypothetical protein